MTRFYKDSFSVTNEAPMVLPKFPENNARILNSRITSGKGCTVQVEEMQSELTKYLKKKNLLPTQRDYNDCMEQRQPEINLETKLSSKSESITQECLTYINQVNSCLTYLMALKDELNEEYSNDSIVTKSLTNTFRDIQALKSTYEMIQETIDKLKASKSQVFYLYQVVLDPVVSNLLKMYKPFLNHYAAIIKWTTQFNKESVKFVAACDRVLRSSEWTDNSSFEQCLYTVFNSLFSLELMFDRYRKCFDEDSEHFLRSTDAKNLISNILKDMNKNQDQESFMVTQKELSLLTGRNKEYRVNTCFVCKTNVIKLSRRDDKPLSRQLVLFSDCLYVTLLPSNILGTSSVRQELSIEFMKLSDVGNNGCVTASFEWGLTINAKEAVQDFFFDSEQTMKTWRDHLLRVIKAESDVAYEESPNVVGCLESLGSEAPRWQKDSAAGYCNGFKCHQKFNAAIRRHHCRADGLLYCDQCCNFKVKLEFERAPESRVCELCYNILAVHRNNADELNLARRHLEGVLSRKTRAGMKTGWLKVKVMNKEKSVFLCDVKYFCELHLDRAVLTFYEKQEDKYCLENVGLSDFEIIDPGSSKHFILEDGNGTPVYKMTAMSEDDCHRWIECIKERIRATTK